MYPFSLHLKSPLSFYYCTCFCLFNTFFHFHLPLPQGVCSAYDIIIVNRIHPLDILKTTFPVRWRSHRAHILPPQQPPAAAAAAMTDMNQNVIRKQEEDVHQPGRFRYLIQRQTLLCASAVGLLVLRLVIVGRGLPSFQTIDNPASFADSVFTRVSACFTSRCMGKRLATDDDTPTIHEKNSWHTLILSYMYHLTCVSKIVDLKVKVSFSNGSRDHPFIYPLHGQHWFGVWRKHLTNLHPKVCQHFVLSSVDNNSAN